MTIEIDKTLIDKILDMPEAPKLVQELQARFCLLYTSDAADDW